jgi:hypothetical protein
MVRQRRHDLHVVSGQVHIDQPQREQIIDGLIDFHPVESTIAAQVVVSAIIEEQSPPTPDEVIEQPLGVKLPTRRKS